MKSAEILHRKLIRALEKAGASSPFDASMAPLLIMVCVKKGMRIAAR
jgi:hypothetical protein